jgi:hypothetical protein
MHYSEQIDRRILIEILGVGADAACAAGAGAKKWA